MDSIRPLHFLIALLFITGQPACQRSSEGVNNEAGNQDSVQSHPDNTDSKPDSTSRPEKRSMFEELESIGQLDIGAAEKSKKAREHLLDIATARGLSLPQLIAGNLSDLLPDPSDPEQLNRLSWLCFGERETMIEFITTLPAGPLRSEVVNAYGGTWAAEHNFAAIKESYELIAPGSDRTTLASLGSRAAYLSSESEKALEWIKSLEYPEEKRIAINEVGSMFTQGLGTPADRAAFLNELQSIATANGVAPPSGKRGEPLHPLIRASPPPAEPSK